EQPDEQRPEKQLRDRSERKRHTRDGAVSEMPAERAQQQEEGADRADAERPEHGKAKQRGAVAAPVAYAEQPDRSEHGCDRERQEADCCDLLRREGERDERDRERGWVDDAIVRGKE